jgi:hypothetical protein
MSRIIHHLPQTRQLHVDPSPGAVLVAQRLVRRQAMPGIDRQHIGKGELRRAVEGLARQLQRCYGDEGDRCSGQIAEAFSIGMRLGCVCRWSSRSNVAASRASVAAIACRR